jgi:hypothetical protein
MLLQTELLLLTRINPLDGASLLVDLLFFGWTVSSEVLECCMKNRVLPFVTQKD